MRHLMSSFLALHWAVLFALLAFVCIGGTAGLERVLTSLGAVHGDVAPLRLDGALTAAPLASAFLVVAALFFWAFMETVLGEDEGSARPIFKIGFVAAGAIFLLVLVYGTMQGINGLFLPSAAHLAAIAVSHMAIQGERFDTGRSGIAGRPANRSAAGSMAGNAAHASLLSRISGRPDPGGRS